MSRRGANASQWAGPDGILILDKPAGISSAATLARVRQMAGAAKGGHAGTLDPFATGILICCLNQATRLARFFLHGEKTYEAVMTLGVRTDTQDATGRVITEAPAPEPESASEPSLTAEPSPELEPTPAAEPNLTVEPTPAVELNLTEEPTPALELNFSEGEIAAVMAGFQGEIEQTPPIYSALKHQGVPLYRLARQGTPVEKPPRRVRISEIRLDRVDGRQVHFTVSCSGGTYIRTLCADIGDRLGCGAHLSRLRRTAAGGFTLADAVDFDALAENPGAGLIPMAEALRTMPGRTADAELARRIAHGMPIAADMVTGAGNLEDPAATGEQSGCVKITNADNRLLAVLRFRPEAGRFDYLCVFQPSKPMQEGG